jgi:SAM-dependent methyltransferase
MTKPVIDLYSKKPWIWERVNSHRVFSEVQFLRKLFKFLNIGSEVLDLGCGFGYHMTELSNDYNIIGIDNDHEIVRYALKKNPSANIIVGDMRGLPYNERFDAVICLQSVLSYCTQNQELINAIVGIKNALKPGGYVMIDVMDALSLLSSDKFEAERQLSWGSGPSKVNLTTKHIIYSQSQIMVTERYWTIEGDNENYYDKTESRLFFPQDLQALLMCNGLTVQKLPDNYSHPTTDRLFLVAQN